MLYKWILLDWYFSLENYKLSNAIIFDWIWKVYKEDNELYKISGNIDKLNRIIENSKKKLNALISWVDFTKPDRNLLKIEKSKDFNNNLWYQDSVLVYDIKNIKKDIWPFWLAWAVWDCAAVCYVSDEMIWISHVWWQWIKNRVIEQVAEVLKEDFDISKIRVYISPAAWVNYRWKVDDFDKNILDVLKDYKIKKDKIFKLINLNEWDFYLKVLVSLILIKNWFVNIFMHHDDTTNLKNRWPSYRIYSLSLKKQFLSKKMINWKIYNSRLWVFNIYRW